MELEEKKLQELKDKKISIEDLNDQYFVEHISESLDDHWGFDRPYFHAELETENILKLLSNKICSFNKLVDRVKSIHDPHDTPCLYALLQNKKRFEKISKNITLSKDDLKHLLNVIDEYNDLKTLCENTSILKFVLKEFVLDKKIVDKVNHMINFHLSEYFSDWRKAHDMHTIFDYIEFTHKNDTEILKLSELNRKVYLLNSFDLIENQKLEISEILKNNEIARNRLIEIVDSNLESQYNFESLINCLKKKEKKNILNI